MNKSKLACPNCGSSTGCSANSACWCMGYPNILEINEAALCLCSRCLLQLIQSKAEELISSKQLDKIKALGPVERPMEGLDYQINSDGNLVFSTWYHLRRGTCCGSGCQNCPYKGS